MVRTAFESGSLLQEFLPLLKEQSTVEDYHRYAHKIAEAIDKTNIALISPAISAYPELESEIESSIRMTGRYRT